MRGWQLGLVCVVMVACISDGYASAQPPTAQTKVHHWQHTHKTNGSGIADDTNNIEVRIHYKDAPLYFWYDGSPSLGKGVHCIGKIFDAPPGTPTDKVFDLTQQYKTNHPNMFIDWKSPNGWGTFGYWNQAFINCGIQTGMTMGTCLSAEISPSYTTAGPSHSISWTGDIQLVSSSGGWDVYVIDHFRYRFNRSIEYEPGTGDELKYYVKYMYHDENRNILFDAAPLRTVTWDNQLIVPTDRSIQAYELQCTFKIPTNRVLTVGDPPTSSLRYARIGTYFNAPPVFLWELMGSETDQLSLPLPN